ncbi:HET-domain-containing protein, partial [Cucurbitaria berberidis CBS 394.84]
SGREIRVLDLLPGSWNDVVKCDIRIVSLDGNAAYEALSYVWGESPDTKSIEVSGQRVLITLNLYSALRRLRYSDRKRAIWIDQLCINQWDISEKEIQVSLMRDTYRACSHCVLWLGEIPDATQGFGQEDAEAVFDFITSVAEKDLALPRERSEQELPTLLQDGHQGEKARKAFAAFAMYGNPWWQRIWTIQESILPDSAELVWGPLSISRKDVMLVARRLKHGPRGNLTSFSVAFQARRRQHDELLRWLLYPVHGFLHSQNGEEPLDLFMRWRHRQATDPRDKVYALLGLLPANILPNAQSCSYLVSVPLLFSQVTLDLIRYEGGLRPLVAASEMAHRTLQLPTWAIDFACSNRVGKRQLKWWGHSHRYGQFSAGGTRELQFAVSNAGKTLALTGALVDQVLDVNEVYTVADDEPLLRSRVWDIMSSSEELVQRFMASQTDLKTYPGGGSWSSALWRAMIGDLIMDEFPIERAKDSHEKPFTQARDRIAQGKPEVPNPVLESLRGMVPNHAFFITESGYIGIGPPHTLPGDQVWVFHGGKVPFLMRKFERGDVGDQTNRLTLVGDAYVHGIMDGEAVKDGHDAHTVLIY